MIATTTERMLTEASVESAPFDDSAARREGWVISGCGIDDSGRQRIELQKLDNPQPGEGTFADDCDAWAHVAEWAAAGSPLHLQALAMVDEVERGLIARHSARA